MAITPNRRKQLLIAGALLGVAATLRLWGIYWAAPQRIDLHPDEIKYVMEHALSISLADPDPKFLNYPSLLMYLIAISNGVASRLGLVSATWQKYVVARSIVAAFGALTAPAAMWLGLELGGSLGGAALGGLWMALLPLHVWESHFAVTDVVMTFWIVVALALSVRLLRSSSLGDYLLIGATIGAAIASKYTAALVGVSPMVATALGRRPLRTWLRGLFGMGAAMLAVSFLGTPFSFLHFGQFRAAMTDEYAHVHSQHYGFGLPAVGWQYHKYLYEICAAFPFSLGLALYASAAAGTVWALLRPRRSYLVVLSFALAFFAIVGHWTFTPLRYQLPVLAISAVFAGLWQGSWLELGGRPRVVAAFAVVVTAAYTTAFTLQTTSRLRHDTRAQAAQWLDETLRPGERLLLCGYRSYLAVPNDARITVEVDTEGAVGKLAGRTDFDLVEITSMHYWRHERHQHAAFLPVYQRLRGGRTPLKLVKRFEADFLNRRFYQKLDPMFGGYFISPTLEFYARDEQAARAFQSATRSTGAPIE